MKYLVSHQGQQLGPLSLAEIVEQVRAKTLDVFDYIYLESQQDWVILLDCPELAAQLKANKPTTPPSIGATSSANTAHNIVDWFVLKGEHRFGPFSYVDVVRMLQQKTVYPFDFVWHAGMAEWRRVAELKDFTPEAIRRLFGEAQKTSGESSGPFIQRRFRRKKYSARVIVHDNLSLWQGHGVEISKGGVGIRMANSIIVPGQKLHLHLSQSEDWPAFNAICEVVSKKYVNDSSPVEYGLRFLSMSQEVQEEFYKKVE